MASEKKVYKIITPEFRVSFPSVWEAKQVDGQGKPKYSVQMLFRVKAGTEAPGEAVVDIAPLKQAVVQVLTDKFGADKAKWPKGLKLPFRDGGEKDYEGYDEGIVFANASSLNKPGVVDADVQPIIEKSEFYGGCYARAAVNPYYWEYMGKKGVSFGLQNIQKLRDGEPFSGRSKPENDFDAIKPPQAEGADAVADPLAGIGS